MFVNFKKCTSKKLMKWIDLADKHPPMDTIVLVTCVDAYGATEPELDYMTCCPEYGYEEWASSFDCEVTHWCEIPALPEPN